MHLEVCSSKRSYQSPEWTILSHVNIASIRKKSLDIRSCWIVFTHVVRGRPGSLFKLSKGKPLKIFLASFSLNIRAMWLNRERRCVWTVVERCKRCGCLVASHKLHTRSMLSINGVYCTWPNTKISKTKNRKLEINLKKIKKNETFKKVQNSDK